MHDEFCAEAQCLAKLPARQRKEALAVHWRIADDTTLSKVTRDHARWVAETLTKELAKLASKKPSERS